MDFHKETIVEKDKMMRNKYAAELEEAKAARELVMKDNSKIGKSWFAEASQKVDSLNSKLLEIKQRDKVDIADITLGFNHGEIIQLLMERGQAIASLDFEKMRKINKKINK